MLSCTEAHKHWNPVGCQIDYTKLVVGTDAGSKDINLLLNFPDNDSLKITVVGIVVGSMQQNHFSN